MRNLVALFLALCITAFAHAAPDEERYLLTVANLQKINAVKADLEKAKVRLDDDDDGDGKDGGKSAAQLARELDANPKVKAVLARHGLSSMDAALSMNAIVTAGIYLMFESSMDKKKAAALYASYPKERQANIELLRKNQQLLK